MNQVVKTITIRGESIGVEKLMQSTQALGVQVEEVVTQTDRASAGFARLERRLDPVAAATRSFERDQKDLNRELNAGRISGERHALMLENARQRMLAATAAAEASAAGFQRQAAAARMSGSAMSGLGGQTGNLAAQLQDIAVSAQMGMNPLMIALQQGTQISAVLGPMGARGAVSALGGAFASLISPVSLATIAIIGLGTYGVSALAELVTGGEDANETLREQHDLIVRVADQWGQALPALRSYVDELKRVKDDADQQRAIQAAINEVYAATRAELPGLSAGFAEVASQMLDMGGRQADIRAISLAMEDLTAKTEAGTATSEEMQASVNALATALSSAGVPAAAGMIGTVDALAASFVNAAAQATMLATEAASIDARMGVPVSPLRGGRGGDPRKIENDDYWRDRYMPAPELMRIPARSLGFGRGGAGGASRSATISEAERERKAVKDLIDTLEYERATIGMSAVEKEQANAIRRAGRAATDEQKAAISGLVAEIHNERDAVKRAADEAEKYARIWRGVGTDITGGLRQIFADGKVEISEFSDWIGDAFITIGDRFLQDALTPIEDGINALFDTLASRKGGGGNWWNMLFGLFGGGLFPAAPGGGGPILKGLFAQGGAFNAAGVVPFARGGAFINSIVDRPTLFPFAKGTGLMGEAGPEAILPLKRGSNGSLGVEMHGGASPVTVMMGSTSIVVQGNADDRTLNELRRELDRRDAKTRESILPMVIEARRRGAL